MDKKAQAAGLVGLVLLIIILYIVFLPPEDREELLGEDNDDGVSGRPKDKAVNLLDESPGTISKDVSELKADKGIPNVFLVQTSEANVLESFNPFAVKNSILGNYPKEVKFSISDLANTDNVILSFSAKKREGVLAIFLNGDSVFNYELTQYNVEPIKLPKHYLQEENTLKFEVSRATIGSNEYQLENVKVIGDVKDVSRRESENTFTILESEFGNLESVSLRFVPYCARERDVGRLRVWINDKRIYNSVPVCDDPVKQSFPVGYLKVGSNDVVFESDRGSYSVEQIYININFKEQRTLTYYFELNESGFSHVQNDTMDLYLTMKFVDDEDTDYRFFYNINGHKRGEYDRGDFERDDITFRNEISRFAEEGNNYIQTIPKTTLKIVSLKVTLEKK